VALIQNSKESLREVGKILDFMKEMVDLK